jgi:hypothetical protein
MGGKSGAPDADPNIGIALLKQSETGDKLLDFVMKSYEDNKPLVEEATANSREDRVRQNRLADQAETRGNEAYDFYQTKGRPVIEQSLKDAQEWDSAGNISKARAESMADVGSQFDQSIADQNVNLARMGINPSAGKFAALNNQMNVQKSLAMAGASNGAANQLKMQGAQLRANGSNIANGLSSGAVNLAGQGSGMGGAANGMAGQPLGFSQANQNQASSGMQSASNIYASNAQGYQNLSNYNLNANAQNNANSPWGGIGQIAGGIAGAGGFNSFFADGGKVDGPGTGTSDSVPATNVSNGQPIRLSNGEFIVSADVVKAKGEEFFNKLQERYHQPSGNMRRAA